MEVSFDREKVVESMFDPITSSIIAELEDGEKECSFLAKQTEISENDVLDRLGYLIEHEFIYKKSNDGKYFLSANTDKLNTVIENSENFENTISGLEKMDSYLN
ncbi:MAG: hypothetical protein K5790_07875 [Nitrosopumilus sp.]|uniref:hypothetical protein n=1 Tax=Nitrosopumilus sp. TaxID=2024843 RepID=UPI00247E2FF5|nr:hypothetical protein [Nitrosopumilus sp.]MCV0393185.1 hypothetical protein [Nitrosopumilus sp.]